VYHVALRGKDAPGTLGVSEQRIGGRYSIGEQIGAGGLATVHVGRDMAEGAGGRTVAIKRLHPPLAGDPEVAATLLDEGRIVARITHPNVVTLFDIIVEEGNIFLILEYVAGESLSSLMRMARSSGARFPLELVCAIGRDMLRGLHAAHQATDERGRPLGVVHRDVSPHNVLVGADGRTRLLDFGVAKAAGQSHTTRPGQIKGKLSYMSPEQLRGGLVTRRSDIYAAAIVMWEMLTLDRPFGEPKDPESAVREVLSRPPRAPSTLRSDVPPSLDKTILRALALDPSERYASAEDMALDLEHSHPAASTARVAAWLREIAGPSLATRAALVARESPVQVAGERVRSPVLQSAVETPQQATLLKRVMLVGAAVLFLVLGLLALLRLRR
jgi:serine/threonine protein kinase